MGALTTVLGLFKPGGGSTGTITPPDTVDIDKINGNMDLIDAWAALVNTDRSNLTPLLKNIVPSSVSAASGTATADANGLVTFANVTNTGAGLTLNGIFSDAFPAYELLLAVESMTPAAGLIGHFAAAGTPDSSGVYAQNTNYNSGASVTSAQANSGTSISVVPVAGNYHFFRAKIANPHQAKNTFMTFEAHTTVTGATGGVSATGGVRVNNSSSYDGITLVPSAASPINGWITVRPLAYA